MNSATLGIEALDPAGNAVEVFNGLTRDTQDAAGLVHHHDVLILEQDIEEGFAGWIVMECAHSVLVWEIGDRGLIRG